MLHGVRKCVYKEPALQPPKWVRIYPQRVPVALRIKLQEFRLQRFWSSGSASHVSRKSFQLKVLCILIPVMSLHLNWFPSNKIDLTLIHIAVAKRRAVYKPKLFLLFKSFPILCGTRNFITMFKRPHTPLVPILSQKNPARTNPFYFSKIHFITVLPHTSRRLGIHSDLFLSGCLTRVLYAFLFSLMLHALYISCSLT